MVKSDVSWVKILLFCIQVFYANIGGKLRTLPMVKSDVSYEL